jgi:hypothetical protein
MYANIRPIDQLADSYLNGAEPTNEGLNRLLSAFSKEATRLINERRAFGYSPVVALHGDGIVAYSLGDARMLAQCFRKLSNVGELDVVHIG